MKKLLAGLALAYFTFAVVVSAPAIVQIKLWGPDAPDEDPPGPPGGGGAAFGSSEFAHLSSAMSRGLSWTWISEPKDKLGFFGSDLEFQVNWTESGIYQGVYIAGSFQDTIKIEEYMVDYTPDAYSDTLFVDAAGGGDYTTVQSAISAADGGELVLIEDGEYTFTTYYQIPQQVYNPPLTIKARNPGKAHILAKRHAFLIGGYQPDRGATANVIIDGLDMYQNAEQGPGCGSNCEIVLKINGESGSAVRDLLIKNCFIHDTIEANDVFKITSDPCAGDGAPSRIWVKNNAIWNGGFGGYSASQQVIDVNSSTQTVFDGNIIFQAFNHGEHFQAWTKGSGAHLVYKVSTVENTALCGDPPRFPEEADFYVTVSDGAEMLGNNNQAWSAGHVLRNNVFMSPNPNGNGNLYAFLDIGNYEQHASNRDFLIENNVFLNQVTSGFTHPDGRTAPSGSPINMKAERATIRNNLFISGPNSRWGAGRYGAASVAMRLGRVHPEAEWEGHVDGVRSWDHAFSNNAIVALNEDWENPKGVAFVLPALDAPTWDSLGGYTVDMFEIRGYGNWLYAANGDLRTPAFQSGADYKDVEDSYWNVADADSFPKQTTEQFPGLTDIDWSPILADAELWWSPTTEHWTYDDSTLVDSTVVQMWTTIVGEVAAIADTSAVVDQAVSDSTRFYSATDIYGNARSTPDVGPVEYTP